MAFGEWHVDNEGLPLNLISILLSLRNKLKLFISKNWSLSWNWLALI